jgi:hypothetical protein
MKRDPPRVQQTPPSSAVSSIRSMAPPVATAARPCEASCRNTVNILSGNITGEAQNA